jgi:hypothetical protein
LKPDPSQDLLPIYIFMHEAGKLMGF